MIIFEGSRLLESIITKQSVMNKPLLVRITSIAALQPKGRHLVADELVSEGSSRKDESRFLIKVIQNDVVQLHCFKRTPSGKPVNQRNSEYLKASLTSYLIINSRHDY